MAGTLTVQNLQGPSTGANANKIIIPSGQTLDVSGGTLTPSTGQIVNYKSYTDTTVTGITSTSYSTVYTYPTYTPILTNSIVVHKFNLLARGYRSGGNDARGRLRLMVDGTTVIEDNEYGGYDYGGSGIWWRITYSNGSIHYNTDGTSVPAYLQLATNGTQIEYNSDDGPSTTRSFYEILEIAQ